MFLSVLPPEIRNAIYNAIEWDEVAKPKAPKSFDDIGGIQIQEDLSDEEGGYGNGQGSHQVRPSKGRRNTLEGRWGRMATATTASSPLIPDSELAAAKLAKRLEKVRQSAHPLALLLTCRQINYEATLIAFGAHTFMTPTHLNVLHKLQHSTSLLSSTQIAAIGSIAYKFPIPRDFATRETTVNPALFIANALVHFPGLQRIKVILQRFPDEIVSWELMSQTTYARGSGGSGEGAQRTGECRVPIWWCELMDRLIEGTIVRWQTGQKWTLYWTQDESVESLREYEDLNANASDSGKMYLTSDQWTARMYKEMGRRAPGTRIRINGWLAEPVQEGRRNREYDEYFDTRVKRVDAIVGMQSELVQEGGRRVTVDMEYWEYNEAGQKLWASDD